MLKILIALKTPSDDVKAMLQEHEVDILPGKEFLFEFASKNSYHLILLEDGIEVLSSLKAIDPRAEVILFGEGEEDVIETVKHGAFAYFSLPIEIDKLRESVHRVSEIVDIRRETSELEKLLNTKYTFAGVVGKNPQMLEIFSFIRRIAPYYRTVTIAGETGTGKEVIAKALHALGNDVKNPFIVCNCGALIENLVESELFGHIKGSFTGAIKDKIGLFEAAGDGTILLDEIGELPFSFQPHLLRVLEDGEFRRVGSHQISRARCKVIAATNKDLEKKVREGKFREDLFFRLIRLIIKIPPLRERKDDIPLLCRHLLERFNQRSGKKIHGISRPAQAALMCYNWPGNIRELENVLEQAAILTTESFIRQQDLPSYIIETGGKESIIHMSLFDIEKRHIETVLQQSNGNRTKAAEILGISRRALLRKIQKFGIK